jgi:SNF2 family DNA or RNA helicase
MTLQLQRLRREDWLAAFEPAVFERGRLYAKQGMTRLVHVTPDTIDARCHGTAERPYRQQIQLSVEDEHWVVDGSCSCPVGHNCKHVVSVLLTLEQLQANGDPRAVPVAPLPAREERLIDDLQPRPRLQLGSHARVHFDARKGRMVEQIQHRAALSFLYGGRCTFGKSEPELRVRSRSGELLRIRRQPDAEAAFRHTLAEFGLRGSLRRSEALPEDAGEPLQLRDEAAWLDFVRLHLPVLREQGWQIEMHPGFRYDLSEIQDWYAQIDSPSDQDWFDLELGIEVDGQRISLLPILLHLIRHTPWLLSADALAQRRDDEVLLVPLPRTQGPERRVGLPFGRLRPLLAHLGELYFTDDDNGGESLRLPPADAARLSQLQQALPLQWQGGEALREFAERLRQLPQQQVQPPVGLQAELRPYQLQGLAWMQALRELGVGGVLADDMGLGKTLQSLAHLLLEKQAGRLVQPALIVMPTSLIPNWQDEAARFAPQLRVLVLQGPKRAEQLKKIGEADVLLTTYALLSRDAKALGRHRYSVLILDEAQTIKNARSKAASTARALQAEQRLCLTGTPLENHLGELWSLFHFLMPGWLGDEKSFARDYRQPIEKHGDALRLAQLNGRIRPFMLRRTKEQVASDLPPKTLITQWVELTDAQRDRYETLRLAMDSKVRAEVERQGLAGSQIVILEALLRLRQVCCDLRLLDEDDSSSAPSAKLTALMQMLEELFAEGRRVLLFSQFTSMLGLIEQELQKRKIPYALLTGATRDRRTPVAEFQAGKQPIFLISLKAGGAGLNLTAADTVIHFAYRIGQDKPVFVYKLIARGSVEEKIQQLQQTKANLARGVLDGGALADSHLSEEDLGALLAPLS